MTEQELILTSVLKCRRVDLYAQTLPFSDAQCDVVTRIGSRRAAHEPLQYILQAAEFMGLDLFVDRRVLIPRPETELLVEAAEKIIAQQKKKTLRILDIGTGSGNIIISLAKRVPGHLFYAVDCSADALEVAKSNAARHGVLNDIHFLKADVLSGYNFFPNFEKFDMIISNPPYIKTGDIASLQAEVQHEPRIALDGGVDGLLFYRKIAFYAKDLLQSQGVVCMEIGQGQADDIKDIFGERGLFSFCECIRDYSDIQRVMIVKRT